MGVDVDPTSHIVLKTSPEDFVRRWVAENAYLGERARLAERWVLDPKSREEIAEELGIPLGRLLRSFNDTAPLGASRRFLYRKVPFEVLPMLGICDDLAEGRFPMFGDPVTLRCYLRDETLLPQRMLEAADWNFMDGGRPGFVGYIYGVVFANTLYVAGLQSDIAVRYAYLFQGRGGITEVREGDEVRPADLSAYGRFVPVLRRSFQRYWISILLGAVLAWAQGERGLSELGLLRFDRDPTEERRGHVVHRVYHDLPERLGASMRCVVVGQERHFYAVTSLREVERYLGARWHQAPSF